MPSGQGLRRNRVHSWPTATGGVLRPQPQWSRSPAWLLAGQGPPGRQMAGEMWDKDGVSPACTMSSKPQMVPRSASPVSITTPGSWPEARDAHCSLPLSAHLLERAGVLGKGLAGLGRGCCNILLLHSRERKRQQAWFYRKKWEGGMADTWG